ncbi:MAG: phage major capsid protein [Ilumatobacteraceae bacterium]
MSDSPTDAMIGRIQGELEERNAFIQGSIQNVQDAERDLTENEKELLKSAKSRVDDLRSQLDSLVDSQAATMEARASIQKVNNDLRTARQYVDKGAIEYRSAGEYIADLYGARMGDRESNERLEIFHRAAAHQTTADNPGLLPERIVESVINGVDVARPLVSAIGPTDLGSGSWAYARVTQHTQVGVQAAEKTELASRKMIVTKTQIVAPTYGGYVNVSRQDIRRTSPGIMDMIINDLAGQYAIQTEDACAAELIAGATAGTVAIPATATAIGIATAVWGAAGQAAALLRTANLPAQGPILAVSADRLGLLGPLFPPVNPQNAYSSGFDAGSVGMQGAQGQLAGLTVVLGTGLPANTVLFLYRSAVRCYEDRYGAMTVDEPSVWGTQVGYAGDFETVVLNAGGVVAISQTP